MLQLGKEQIPIGARVLLTEKWHEKLCNFMKQSIPYNFVVCHISKQNKEIYYLLESEKSKKVKIALSQHVIKYLFACEVPDSNVGLSFKEYLPDEGTTILITNIRNPSEVIPGIFEIDTELLPIEQETTCCLSFKINFINGIGFTDIRTFCDGSRKSTWKFLMNEDESYMTDYEKMFKDTIVHKGYVMKSAKKLARYLEREGATKTASELIQRATVHDNSKITNPDELRALARIINDKSTLKDANKQLSPIRKDAIALHYKNNTHHPEHFASILDMSKLDIMEMCCDWYARSSQYHTNFLQFVEKQQEIRFHFPDWLYPEILHYCKVLDSDI